MQMVFQSRRLVGIGQEVHLQYLKLQKNTLNQTYHLLLEAYSFGEKVHPVVNVQIVCIW